MSTPQSISHNEEEVHRLLFDAAAAATTTIAMEKMEIILPNKAMGIRRNWQGIELRYWKVLLILLIIGFVGCFHGASKIIRISSSSADDGLLPVAYDCPTNIRHAANEDESFISYYEQSEKENITALVESFRTESFDAWGYTYKDVKAGLGKWKRRVYPPNIESGGSIYESASGIGFNLYMTLEILEEHGITDIVVYGNEYMNVSTVKSKIFFDHATLPKNTRTGRLCTGDSADLSFVPSDSFDLVFTGYISPILDPFGFEFGNLDADFVAYKKICEGAKQQGANNDPENKDILLIKLAQEKQDNFYGKWVSEMIRIAKPGSAVIVESVSVPYCKQYMDWGGVDEEFWKTGVERYGWAIDPDSLFFDKDVLFKDRYHVFMRKTKHQDT